MALTNAQRQKNYRENNRSAYRLNMSLDWNSGNILSQLAAKYSVSKKAMIEAMIQIHSQEINNEILHRTLETGQFLAVKKRFEELSKDEIEIRFTSIWNNKEARSVISASRCFVEYEDEGEVIIVCDESDVEWPFWYESSITINMNDEAVLIVLNEAAEKAAENKIYEKWREVKDAAGK